MSGPRRHRHRLLAPGFWALLLIALSLAPVAPIDAAQRHEPTGRATFGELSASPDFPTTITFSLSVESPEEIVRAELLFAPRWVETLNLIEAAIDPGERVEVDFPLNMYQHYFPPGLDLLYRWRVTDAAGNATESEEQVVLWEDTRFDWQVLSTEQVSVFYYTGNQGFNQQILQSAQATVDELQAEFEVERSRPLRIWVYDSREDFAGAQQPNSERWFVGASFSGLYLILSVIPDGNEYELDRVVPHEVSHQLLHQAAENPFNMPARWLDEGIAVYNQDSDKEGYENVLNAAVEEGRLIPLAGLHRQFPFDDTYRLAYAQSLSVVEFIIAEWGEAALGDVLDAYREGVSHDEALQRGLGVTLHELETRWRERLGYGGDRPAEDGTGGPIGTIAIGAGAFVPTELRGVALALALLLAVGAIGTGHRHAPVPAPRRSAPMSLPPSLSSPGRFDRSPLA